MARLGALIALLCMLALPAYPQESEVSGRVIDERGNPLPEVEVGGFHKLEGGGVRTDRTDTDKDGRYQLHGDGRVIFFRKVGFKPVTRVRSAGDSPLNVTLEPETSGWKLPQCTPEQQRTHTRGEGLLFLLPSGAKLKEVSDDDYTKTLVFFPGDQEQSMLIWSGGTLGGGILYFPNDEWYLDGSVIGEKGDLQAAIDVRGKMPDGRHWRSTSTFFDIAQYHGASDAAAKWFDQIIDSACLRDYGTKK